MDVGLRLDHGALLLVPALLAADEDRPALCRAHRLVRLRHADGLGAVLADGLGRGAAARAAAPLLDGRGRGAADAVLLAPALLAADEERPALRRALLLVRLRHVDGLGAVPADELGRGAAALLDGLGEAVVGVLGGLGNLVLVLLGVGVVGREIGGLVRGVGGLVALEARVLVREFVHLLLPADGVVDGALVGLGEVVALDHLGVVVDLDHEHRQGLLQGLVHDDVGRNRAEADGHQQDLEGAQEEVGGREERADARDHGEREFRRKVRREVRRELRVGDGEPGEGHG